MCDVEEIIDYIKSLKRGFDKELFQSKVDELAYVVESNGLEYDDFHTLFKVWLNLSIPITKWVSLGSALVPRERVEEQTIDYAFRWLLGNCENHNNFSRMAFLLDWLTAAMDSDNIDIKALDSGYEIFHTMLSFEVLTAHTVKLVYSLTKPSDVTRGRVLELLDHAKKREGKKNMLRQIQVLLGLFKSYKPECVPENIPAISVHTSFRKINANLVARFHRNQERRNTSRKERSHLLWLNPLNCESRRNKKADLLVPNMEFCNIGSKQYADKEPQKNYLDFSDPVSLLQYSLQRPMSRPARLRALLCNEAGLMLLAVSSEQEQAFFSHDLYHLLTNCFLESSAYSYAEKQDFLRRLAVFQRTLLQGLPVVTRFLAQYLPFWNEKDFFGEILQLVEWLSVESADHVAYIVEALTKIYLRAQPMEQCAILGSLTNMYTNIVYVSTRRRQRFVRSRTLDYPAVLVHIAGAVDDMCHKALQISPDDMRIAYSGVWSCCAMRRAELSARSATGAGVPPALPLALPLLAPSAALLDKLAALMILYKKIFASMKARNQLHQDQTYIEQRKVLEGFTSDLVSCLLHEEALSRRKSGLVFAKLHPQLVSKLADLVPEADAKFSLRNNLAFAPYTYVPLEAVDPSDLTNRFCFDTAVKPNFPYLSQFLMRVVPEWR